MTPLEIKQALTEKGLNYSILADATGVPQQRFSMVATRNQKSTPVATLIAKALEKPLEEVFPDYSINKAADRKATVEALRQRLAS